jgi:Mor family transcriptional regulator
MSKNRTGRRERKAKRPAAWEGFALELSAAVECALTSPMENNLSSKQLAEHVVLTIFKSLGGQVVYIPMGLRVAKARRNEELFSDWKNGFSITDLAKKYKLTAPSVYDLIARLKDEAAAGKPNTDTEASQ